MSGMFLRDLIGRCSPRFKSFAMDSNCNASHARGRNCFWFDVMGKIYYAHAAPAPCQDGFVNNCDMSVFAFGRKCAAGIDLLAGKELTDDVIKPHFLTGLTFGGFVDSDEGQMLMFLSVAYRDVYNIDCSPIIAITK